VTGVTSCDINSCDDFSLLFCAFLYSVLADGDTSSTRLFKLFKLFKLFEVFEVFELFECTTTNPSSASAHGCSNQESLGRFPVWACLRRPHFSSFHSSSRPSSTGFAARPANWPGSRHLYPTANVSWYKILFELWRSSRRFQVFRVRRYA
jgi:hypothetical protein